MRYTLLTNKTVINNTVGGITIQDMKNAQIINVTASCNTEGIYSRLANNTNFSSISVTNNVCEGMSLFTVYNSNITELAASNNRGNGIGISLS